MTPMQTSRALRELAQVPSRAAARVALELRAELMRSFAQGTDPYGRRWAPLKPSTLAKGRRPPPLTHTGRGKRGIKFAPLRGAGVSITSSVGYLGTHMRATPDRAARKFLPEGVLPKRWREIWQRAVDAEVRKTGL